MNQRTPAVLYAVDAVASVPVCCFRRRRHVDALKRVELSSLLTAKTLRVTGRVAA